MTLAPDRPLPHSSLGRVLLELGRTDDALAAFAEALRLAPRDETSLAGRADALSAAGRQAEAAGVLDLLAETQARTAACPTPATPPGARSSWPNRGPAGATSRRS